MYFSEMFFFTIPSGKILIDDVITTAKKTKNIIMHINMHIWEN